MADKKIKVPVRLTYVHDVDVEIEDRGPDEGAAEFHARANDSARALVGSDLPNGAVVSSAAVVE